MKPYTLKWWVDKLQHAQHRKRTHHIRNDNYTAVRYLELEYYIRDRIITKYGE